VIGKASFTADQRGLARIRNDDLGKEANSACATNDIEIQAPSRIAVRDRAKDAGEGAVLKEDKLKR